MTTVEQAIDFAFEQLQDSVSSNDPYIDLDRARAATELAVRIQEIESQRLVNDAYKNVNS